ncbi:MAG: hypothetical protein ACK51N_02510 [bacterium]
MPKSAADPLAEALEDFQLAMAEFHQAVRALKRDFVRRPELLEATTQTWERLGQTRHQATLIARRRLKSKPNHLMPSGWVVDLLSALAVYMDELHIIQVLVEDPVYARIHLRNWYVGKADDPRWHEAFGRIALTLRRLRQLEPTRPTKPTTRKPERRQSGRPTELQLHIVREKGDRKSFAEIARELDRDESTVREHYEKALRLGRTPRTTKRA